MSKKSHISPGAKKILIGVGVGFGTIMVFLVSFILAFTLIVNPINFMTVSDADTVEENEQLKEQVQTLKDEVEVLNTTVEKYKNAEKNASKTGSATVQQAQPAASGGSNTSQSTAHTEKVQTQTGKSDGEAETDAETGKETSKEGDASVTIIDVSE